MKTLSFQLPEEMAEKLEFYARQRDRSKGWLIRDSLTAYLQKQATTQPMTLQILRNVYRSQILALAEQYHAENLRIFGSVARGDATPDSDVDILVHFKPGASLWDESGLETDLSELLGFEVDLVNDRTLRQQLQPTILAQAVPL
jgi:hypothetical protein